MTSTNITGITDSEFQREKYMTVINNNIKALIASQTQQTETRPLSASISRLDTAPIIDKKTADQACTASLAPPSATASMQLQISNASGITDLLIRLRELALQALNAIRPQLACQVTDRNSLESMETELSNLEASCSKLVTKIDLAYPSQTNRNAFTKVNETETLDSPTQHAQYAQNTSALARAEIERQAGKALLAQANQRPAFVMALLH